MEQDFMVEPDLKFIRDMKKAGGDSLKKCFQCATCSVVCKLTPDDSPFPRKEMIWAQWGQKEKLMSDPDVWLCHQCNDCTTNCPRGAKPGDVLAAIRNEAFTHYAFPSFIGKMLSRPAYLPIIMAVPVIILLAVVGLFGEWEVPVGEIIYANFYPELAIDATFLSFLFFALISLGVGLNRFWKAMVERHGQAGLMGAPVPNLLAALPTIFAHSKFRTCDEGKERYYGHLGVFYGFVGAFAASALVMVGYWGFGIHTPYPTISLVKLIGNLGGAAIVIGALIVLVKRFSYTKGSTGYNDWVLIALVLGLGVTGLATQFVRLADMRGIAYPTYLIHLVFVAYLFLYLPFSKMAHIAYRTVGMTFARQAQRDLLVSDEVALEAKTAVVK
ncbi:MAG: quinone-interacting membrane-bound oxidoreductase complex subunit QmoC [Actinobacteria bacterium]|nr:quinone-interacting membrane-bound oxidoreductase complex subunit QmoC [Actinomycetota bacterium]